MEKIRIPLNQTWLGESLKEYFDNNIEDISDAFSYDFLRKDGRAQVDEIRVTSVEFKDSNKIEITYEIDWSANYTCSDANISETEEDYIIATIIDGNIEMDKPKRVEERSTVDEL